MAGEAEDVTGGAFAAEGGEQSGTPAAGAEGGEAFSQPGEGGDGGAPKGDAAAAGGTPAEGASNEGGDKGKAGSEKEGKSEGAPEKYEAFTLPKGATVNEPMMADFQAECRSRGFTQEQAQAHLDTLLGWKEKNDKAVADYWTQQQSIWSQAAKTEGLLTKETLGSAAHGLKAADKTGGLGKILHSVGLDRHPAVIRVFAEYGAARQESDPPHNSGKGGGGPKSLEDKIFGDSSPAEGKD